MLISEQYKFVYIKTHKTASSSVEGLLGRLCAPEGYDPIHAQEEIQSEFGYVSGRSNGRSTSDLLHPHASAQNIRKAIGVEKFTELRKVYCVRNPYDKVVSWFWWVMPPRTRKRLDGDIDAAKALFQDWLCMRPELPKDRRYYKTSDGKFEASVIRYENLKSDIQTFVDSIGATIDLTALPSWKSGRRLHKTFGYMDYYNAQCREVVEENFAFDFKNFGYSKF